MRRREFIAAIVSGAAWPFAAHAQSAKVWRIGVLETIPEQLNKENIDALRQGLRTLGYVEGRNLIIEYRSADGRPDRFPVLAKEFVEAKVDLIVTRGTPAALAAKAATSTVPIVMAAMGEPLMMVSSLSKPGGNATGLSSFVTELQAKRLEVLRDIIPSIKRVGAFLTMNNPVTPPQWVEIEGAARKLGIEPRLMDVRAKDDLASAMATASEFQANALMIGTGALLQNNAKLLAELSIKHRLPTMHVSREWVDEGGLISYGPSYPDLYRRSAAYIEKIFKGAAAGDLPIEQPTKFEMIVNARTAKAMDLAISPSLLSLADEVIE